MAGVISYFECFGKCVSLQNASPQNQRLPKGYVSFLKKKKKPYPREGGGSYNRWVLCGVVNLRFAGTILRPPPPPGNTVNRQVDVNVIDFGRICSDSFAEVRPQMTLMHDIVLKPSTALLCTAF